MNNPQRDAGRRDSRNNPQQSSFDKQQIKLAPGNLPTDLFCKVAEDAAKDVAQWKEEGQCVGRDASKSTQLRKFYDEICMWNSKVQQEPERFEEVLPFILMLKAKVAYAKGRKHVNGNYFTLLNHCLTEIENNPCQETLNNLKFFMEAFTGFYKVYGPKN
ncbi:MAG: type III-A CRISPR-associated protein Csm2 [Nitrospira sp. SB0677_bin_15]|nr:type III-A CRISPR-associated protein Csm2 [Nitrospira sp. SB0661_bin_20]MYG40594.1 type III-A CRISPR-associated protein Csm2 [Nitrospira sp. SB0677_bin_15]MYH02219.1 type III-A CRISPR-associated protein Csm2 [Nitrospira sp. SB0675_bin_23]MYJ23126.1 type III-A CRISPR-associated protein Csm2 [Nitrospira sp. SB0673_bin_12]